MTEPTSPTTATPSRLDPASSVLLIVDWQERLQRAMPDGLRDAAVKRAETLLWLARRLGIPVLCTEQYPNGLGPTLQPLRVPDPIAKLCFSCMGSDPFVERLKALGRRQVVMCGMETHICVAQTCRDLVVHGYEPWPIVDAVLSRRKLDWAVGVDRMRRDGARVTTTEAALFEWVGKAGNPVFNELRPRLQ